MKILLLQLSKLDSCLQTFPLVNGLVENYKASQVDILVREKNAKLLAGISYDVGEVVSFEDQSTLLPIAEEGNRRESLLRLKRMIGGLQQKKYDLVINLSFSPLSSYVANELEAGGSSVLGYNRTSDGFLKINGDASAYYFAQCGAGETNRAHLREVWANVCGFDSEVLEKFDAKVGGEGIVLCLDGSSRFTTFEAHKWTNIARSLLNVQGEDVYLLGGPGSDEMRASVEMLLNSDRIVNLESRYGLAERASLLKKCRLLITSANFMVALADRVRTPSVAIFTSADNFYEKGPRTPTSRILYSEDLNGIASDQVCSTAMKVINKDQSNFIDGEYLADWGVPSFVNEQDASFAWKFAEAIYLDKEWPALETEGQLEAFAKLYELNQLAFDQLERISDLKDRDLQTSTQVLDRVDELIEKVGRLESSLAPLVNWYRTEKIRIEPGEVEQLVRDTRSVHDMMNGVVVGYLGRYDVLSAADMEVRNENRSLE